MPAACCLPPSGCCSRSLALPWEKEGARVSSGQPCDGPAYRLTMMAQVRRGCGSGMGVIRVRDGGGVRRGEGRCIRGIQYDLSDVSWAISLLSFEICSFSTSDCASDPDVRGVRAFDRSSLWLAIRDEAISFVGIARLPIEFTPAALVEAAAEEDVLSALGAGVAAAAGSAEDVLLSRLGAGLTNPFGFWSGCPGGKYASFLALSKDRVLSIESIFPMRGEGAADMGPVFDLASVI